ncbi:MAG: response regulator [Planctomycetaceae bacterium]|nr:response regulator [Planctomycetaceae bacterium]
MRTIIADDSNTMRRILQNMLEEVGGPEALTADGGDVVLELLKQHPDVGLILMDWNMPCIDGLQCLRHIRSNPATEDIAVVMVSSEALRERILEAIQAGATNYLMKPFEIERFRAVIGPILQNPGHRANTRRSVRQEQA